MAVIDDIARHVESTYPEEGCGIVLRGENGLRAVPLKNVYDKYHAKLPEQFPRTNKTAYRFDPLELQRALEGKGTLVCIFHSHCDVGAYFSKEDSDMAAPEGTELWPNVKWLVVAVDQGKTSTSKLFTFREGRFAEEPVDRI